MATVKPKKHIQVSIEYSTPAELGQILGNIKRLAMSGVETYKEQQDGTKYEYHHQYKAQDDIEVRFEEINGKPCIVIPSRMNGEK